MTECTICLHCNVSGWEYQREVLNGEHVANESLISLTGEVEYRGFVKRMPFDFRLVSGLRPSNIPELTETNVLEINDAMPQYELPESLSALIPIEEIHLQDLKECLIQSASNPSMSLSITLTVDGLKMIRRDKDLIMPIDGRTMTITSFTWNLSYKCGKGGAC